MTKEILVPITAGELLDKISILTIKVKEIGSEHCKKELELLLSVAEQNDIPVDMDDYDYKRLTETNEYLWGLEEIIRKPGNTQSYIVFLAKEIIKANDLRAQIKRDINHIYDVGFKEEKSYDWFKTAYNK